MTARRPLAACIALIGALAAGAFAPAAGANTFYFSGTVEQCTVNCDSFVFLGTGSTLDGFVALDDAQIADGTYDGDDVTSLSFRVFDPAFPPTPPSDPPNPLIDNPFVVDPTPDGGGIVVANGQQITNPRGTWDPCVPPAETGCVRTSAGTTDGETLTSGFLDFWLTEGLLAANGAVITLSFDEQCIDELTPGAQPIPPPCFEVNVFERLGFVAGGTVTSVTEVVTVDPASLDFGTVTVGSSADLDVTVTSNVWSGTDAGLTNIVPALSGPSASEFEVADNTCDDDASLGFEESCVITTTYAPTLAGEQSATLTIPFTEVDGEGAVEVALAGEGVIAQEIAVEPAALEFGDVEMGTDATLELTVRNEGTLDLTITDAAIGGPDAADFTFEGECGVLGEGGTCMLTVTFAPGDLGDRSATLTITSDDEDEGTLEVPLSGTGVLLPDIEVTPLSLDFGEVFIGASEDLEVTITNAGEGPLTVSEIGGADTLDAPFTIAAETCTAAPVDPGAGCVVTVHFQPAADGAFDDTFSIASDDPDEAVVTVEVSGSGAEFVPPPPFPNAPLAEFPDDGSCFIATAAYGSYLDPHVVVLRRFRDRVLLATAPGRAFVDFYYATSPPVADFIRDSAVLRAAVRAALTPVVYALAYPGASLLVLGGLLVVSVGTRHARRAASG